jgi:hypothetical protein
VYVLEILSSLELPVGTQTDDAFADGSLADEDDCDVAMLYSHVYVNLTNHECSSKYFFSCT